MNSRRDFLKIMGLGVGVVVAAPLLAAPTPTTSFARSTPTALGGKKSKIYAETIDDENPSMPDLDFGNPYTVTKASVGLGNSQRRRD